MMKEEAIMIRWGLPPPGREHRALEVLRTMTDWLVAQQREGHISGFQQFGYNTGPLHERTGFVIIEGSREQMQQFLWSESVREEIKRLALVLTNVNVDVLELGAAVKRRLDGWDAAVKEMQK